VSAQTPLEVSFDAEPRNDAWDAFVDASPGGSHTQSSVWAEVKAQTGWRTARVIARRDGAIVAGAQLLLSDLPVVGPIAYSPRGPLSAEGHADALAGVLDGIDELAGRERLIQLKLQPPADRADIVPLLTGRGYRESDLEVAPFATLRVDVQRPSEEILASMRKGHRSNVGKSERKGVEIRAGTSDADFETFLGLARATARRQGFPLYPVEYYETIWRGFGDRSRIQFAEHEGKPMAGILLIAVSDTASYKVGGWSGERTNIHPNELNHFRAMEWARERGCRWYDFEGIPPTFARGLVAGRDVEIPERGDARFKLGFGGEVVVHPCTYDRDYRPVLARALGWAGRARVGGNPHDLALRLLGRTRAQG
jgi:lipid II:glycine glycyltransferase (peptidoglycan interpeptide bridge formation enzyme)